MTIDRFKTEYLVQNTALRVKMIHSRVIYDRRHMFLHDEESNFHDCKQKYLYEN